MAIRLGGATIGVAILAYFVGPLPVMWGVVCLGIVVLQNHGIPRTRDN